MPAGLADEGPDLCVRCDLAAALRHEGCARIDRIAEFGVSAESVHGPAQSIAGFPVFVSGAPDLVRGRR
jgi:hypothetical protein